MVAVGETLTLLTTLVALTEACDRRPALSAATATMRSFRSFKSNQLILIHRDPVTLLCTGDDAAALRIQKGDKYLETEEINSTTIKFCMEKPNLAPSTYSCMYNTSCEDSVTVIVRPAMSLSAAHLHWMPDIDGQRVYFVPQGEDYEVFCSGNEGASLNIEGATFDRQLISESVNRTTVKHKARADSVRKVQYWCISEYFISTHITVVSDALPKAQQFRCIAYEMSSKLECSWTSPSKRNSFKLYLSHVGGKSYLEPKVLCADFPGAYKRGCTWSNIGGYDHTYYHISSGNFSLMLQSCNEIFCNNFNQTFHLNLESITKLDPPSEAKLLRVSSREAVIAWRPPKLYSDPDSPYEHRLEYRLLGTDWRYGNSSSVRCDSISAFYGYTCELKLDLPCPAGHYEVRVYVKLKVATDDRHWSEPATVFFYTAQSTEEEERSPECAAEFEEREPPPSAAVMLHQVRRLISYERKESAALRKKIKALKQKRAKVKALMEAIAALAATGA